MDAIRPLNPPACRRVLWILLVRSCTVCFVFGLCLDFPLARIFASSNSPPSPLPPSSSASRFLSFVSTFVYRHDSVSTQTPVYAKPTFCVSSSCFSSASFVAMRWVRLCPRLAQHAHVLFSAPISTVVLAIGLLCHSYTFYVPIPHTGGLSIHLLLCKHHLHAQPFYVWPFPKTLVHTLLRFKFKPWFTLCKSASSC